MFVGSKVKKALVPWPDAEKKASLYICPNVKLKLNPVGLFAAVSGKLGS